ncbi:MAG: hypothetical protein EXS14_06910 [Planctomycetes bacterium]|nr:hypothetical protein [Planctomycetota bacterium]
MQISSFLAALFVLFTSTVMAQGAGNNRDLVLNTSFAGASASAAAKYLPGAGVLNLSVTSPAGSQAAAPLFVAFDLRPRGDFASALQFPTETDALGLGANLGILLDGTGQGLGIISMPTTVGANGWQFSAALPDLRQFGSPSLRMAALCFDAGAPNGFAVSRTVRHDVECFTSQVMLTGTEYAASTIMGYGTEVGDINNDGIGDVLAGMPQADPTGVANCGEVRVYIGPSLNLSFALVPPTPQANAWFGQVVRYGDVTGDGVVDLLIGARQEDVNGLVDAGAVYVYPGPSFTTPIRLVGPAPQAGARFGHAICVTDWNGDGLGDLVVGAPKANVGAVVQAGKVFVFCCSTLNHMVTLENPLPAFGAKFGYALAGGDLNGDGLGDVAACVPYHDVGANDDTGGMAVYFSPNTVPAAFYTQPFDNGAVLGDAVVRADFNADGFQDLAVGSEFDDQGALDGGSVHIVWGPTFTQSMELISPEASVLGGFGSDVAAGDVNRDGFMDLVAGEFYADPMGVVDAGQAWVAFGPYFETKLKVVPADANIGANAGRRIACGDTNGDGFADMVFGAPLSAPGGNVNNDEGAIYIAR